MPRHPRSCGRARWSASRSTGARGTRTARCARSTPTGTARVAAELPAAALGPRVELGSGPGFAREFIPELELTDVVRAPWHDREVSADALPFGDASLGALVLFDVLHHLPAPARFFAEAVRVLRPGGRVVLCEPYVSPLSYPVYKLSHDEPLDLRVDPLADAAADGARDPFDSNQAIPTLLFGRARARVRGGVPGAAVRCVALPGRAQLSGLGWILARRAAALAGVVAAAPPRVASAGAAGAAGGVPDAGRAGTCGWRRAMNDTSDRVGERGLRPRQPVAGPGTLPGSQLR